MAPGDCTALSHQLCTHEVVLYRVPRHDQESGDDEEVRALASADRLMSTFTFEHRDMRLGRAGITTVGPELHVHESARPAFLVARCHESDLPVAGGSTPQVMDTEIGGGGSAHRQSPAPQSCRAVMLLIRDCEAARHKEAVDVWQEDGMRCRLEGMCAPNRDATSQSGFDMLERNGDLSRYRGSIGTVLPAFNSFIPCWSSRRHETVRTVISHAWAASRPWVRCSPPSGLWAI